LLAHEDDVEKAGGYELYGGDRLEDVGYEFKGVVMRAFDKSTIYALWHMHYSTEIPHQPEIP
jgi:hypothetical protein